MANDWGSEPGRQGAQRSHNRPATQRASQSSKRSMVLAEIELHGKRSFGAGGG
jgi:hypothetical protein